MDRKIITLLKIIKKHEQKARAQMEKDDLEYGKDSTLYFASISTWAALYELSKDIRKELNFKCETTKRII